MPDGQREPDVGLLPLRWRIRVCVVLAQSEWDGAPVRERGQPAYPAGTTGDPRRQWPGMMLHVVMHQPVHRNVHKLHVSIKQ